MKVLGEALADQSEYDVRSRDFVFYKMLEIWLRPLTLLVLATGEQGFSGVGGGGGIQAYSLL